MSSQQAKITFPRPSRSLGERTSGSLRSLLRGGCHFALLAQTVKNLPTMRVSRVRSLGQEDPLKKGVAAQSSILAWRIPRTEEPGRLQSMELQRVRHD